MDYHLSAYYDDMYGPNSGTMFDSMSTYRSRSLQRLHSRRQKRNKSTNGTTTEHVVKLPEITLPSPQESSHRLKSQQQLFGGSFLQNRVRWRTRGSCKVKPKKSISVEHLHLPTAPKLEHHQAMAVICLEEDLNRLGLQDVEAKEGGKSAEAQSTGPYLVSPPTAPNPDLDLPPSYSELFGSGSQ